MLAGLREAKISRTKRIKVCYFPGERWGGGGGDWRFTIPFKFLTLRKSLIMSSSISVPTTAHIELLEQIKRRRITHLKNTTTFWNRKKRMSSASCVHRDGLHIKLNGTIMQAGNLLSRVRAFWYNVDSNKETKIVSSSNYKSLINDNSAIQLDSVTSVLKHLRLNHPQ